MKSVPTTEADRSRRRRSLRLRLIGGAAAIAAATSVMLGIGPAPAPPAAEATVCGSSSQCFAMTQEEQASYQRWDTGTWTEDPMTPWIQQPGTYITLTNTAGQVERIIEGGERYNDNDGQLRTWFTNNVTAGTNLGALVFYEYDVYDRQFNGGARRAERFVRAVNPNYPGQEVVFITVDHYANFYRVS